jgi:hemoglobin
VADDAHEITLFAAVGGMPFFETLVDRFYDGVVDDEVLLPLYPDQADLAGARRRLTLFLAQYWGGPHTYMDERGHPMLRKRHFPFRIGELERDRWLVHMLAAIEDLDPAPDVRDQLVAYMVNAAEHLRNDDGLRLGPTT